MYSPTSDDLSLLPLAPGRGGLAAASAGMFAFCLAGCLPVAGDPPSSADPNADAFRRVDDRLECTPAGCRMSQRGDLPAPLTVPAAPRLRPVVPTPQVRTAGQGRAALQFVAELPRGRSYGTAFLVRPDLAVTCAHLVDEGALHLRLGHPGQLRAGQVLATDPANDLAAIRLPAVAGEQVLPIATAPAAQCSHAVIAGYGPMGEAWRLQPATVLGYCRVDGAGPANTMVLDRPSRAGDSGAPVLDGRGQVVAVLWGTDRCRSYGTWAGRLTRFLDRLPAAGQVDHGNDAIAGRGGAPDAQDTPATCPPAIDRKELIVLRSKVASLDAQLAETRAELDRLRLTLAGRPAAKRGPAGPPGVITIHVLDQGGIELYRREQIRSGSTVRLRLREVQ